MWNCFCFFFVKSRSQEISVYCGYVTGPILAIIYTSSSANQINEADYCLLFIFEILVGYIDTS